MAYITELSTAFTLCMCNNTQCLPTCPICYSPRWSKGACVQQLWREHAASGEGQAAAQRFNEMIDTAPSLGDVVEPQPFGVKMIGGMPYIICDNMKVDINGQITPYPDVLSDAQIVERTIDFAEQLGMYMEPWQAAALRAILLHGGDIAITRGGRGY